MNNTILELDDAVLVDAVRHSLIPEPNNKIFTKKQILDDAALVNGVRHYTIVEPLLKNHFDPNQNRIVCSANRSSKTGEIILGVRHCDEHMLDQRKRLEDFGANGDWDQGFIDKYGRWWNRQDAWRIAVAAQQIVRRCGGDDAKGGTLYSDNLY